jgi:hypothetical protein
LTQRVDRLPVAVLIASAAAFTFGVLWWRSWHDPGPPSYDIYGFFYPNQVYAWRSVRAGSGLLWNPYQDCGQPFFAMSQVGLLYPVNVVFALLEREPALLASVLLNLSIAGIGTLLLGGALGLGAVPALCGALAFQLGWVTTWLASWSPIHVAAFAWLPVALWRTERLLETPDPRRAVALAAVLALQHLPGFFQIGFFTYQLVALRVAWACVARAEHPRRVLACLALALVLSVLLPAVQLLPALEVARESVRTLQLDPNEIGPSFSWSRLVSSLTSQTIYPGYAVIVLLALAALLALRSAVRREAVAFYWFVAVVYFVLGLGPGSPLYDLYARLPLGNAFRGAGRLQWVTSFALAVLAGWGAEVLLRPAPASARALRAGVLTAGIIGLRLLAPSGFTLSDVLLGVVLLAATALAGQPRWGVNALVVPLVVGVGCLVFGRLPIPLFGLRPGDLYGAHTALFDSVRARLTPQDRVLIAGAHPDFALMPKSASLFRLPSIFDYETQAPRRYVDFFTYLRTGHRLRVLRDWYWVFDQLLPATLQRRLFDVTAVRYVIVDRRADQVEQALRGGVRLVEETDNVRVYENQQALPRARYVSRVMVASEDDVLPQVAGSDLDPRQVAWVNRAPPAGVPPADDGATGSAEIETDLPGRVVVRVSATHPGFLFLADQYFPGWTAQVNGAEQEIVPADHAFRLVAVPAGDSTVVFDYRPLSVRLGALISALTLSGVALLWIGSVVRRPNPHRN